MSTLGNILNGTVTSNFILIEDFVQNDGIPFLFSLTRKIAQKVDRVELFCTDSSSESMIEKYDQTSRERVRTHAIYDDPLNWKKTTDLPRNLGYDTDLYEYLNKKDRDGTDPKNTVIVIDSLSVLLLLNNNLGSVSRMIAKLKQNGTIVCLLHSDVHDDHVTNSIEHLSSTILRLSLTDRSLVSVIHKYQTGKVTKDVVKFAISFDKLEITELTKSTEVTRTESADKEVHQLASKLTFAVSLKEEEKRSRAKLILPYERVSNVVTNTTAPNTSGGKIIYEPDAADDYDDEDPDDDLDL